VHGRLVLLITTSEGLFACRLWALSDSSRVKTERKKKERESQGGAEMTTSDMFWERTRQEFQSVMRGVFLGFWGKKVTLCTWFRFHPLRQYKLTDEAKKQAIGSFGTELQTLVVRETIRIMGDSLEGFFCI
jgi:hypothetical protein